MSENQLDLLKKQHGGARSGAGAKKKRARGSVTMRVPRQYHSLIKYLIENLDEFSTKELGEKKEFFETCERDVPENAVYDVSQNYLSVQIEIEVKSSRK